MRAALRESVGVRAALGEGALDLDWDSDTLGVADRLLMLQLAVEGLYE